MSSVGAQPDVLDDARYIPLLVLSAISGTLSILGSGSVIYMTSRNLSTKLMDRLVFSLSVSDMFSSISSVLMPYLIPQYIGLAGASGSHASCSAIGFIFMSFVMMGCCYNSYLSIYYLLVVRRSWKEHDFQKPLEKQLKSAHQNEKLILFVSTCETVNYFHTLIKSLNWGTFWKDEV